MCGRFLSLKNASFKTPGY